MKCPKCGTESNGLFCSNCGTKLDSPTLAKQKKPEAPVYKKWWFWVSVVLFLLAIISSFNRIPTAVFSVADTLGIGNESFTSIDDGYQCVYGNTIITFVMKNKTVKSVESGEIIFYSNGKVIHKVTDIIPDNQEINFAKQKTKELVLDSLKAPSSAKFPNSYLSQSEDWKIAKNKDTIIVSSYVDAENSFGAMLRTDFLVQYSISGNDWTVVTYVLGDKVYVG